MQYSTTVSSAATHSSTVVSTAGQALQEDLKKSGIGVEELGAYLAGPSELSACNVRAYSEDGLSSPGYVIPYYDSLGKRVPFYRLRVFNPLPGRAKYLQPPDSSSYIYFPKQFKKLLSDVLSDAPTNSKINGFRPTIMIVEGEKKAAKAVKEGFLCVGLGGVYNWRSRTIILPAEAKLTKDEVSGKITVKLPSGSSADSDSSIDAQLRNKWAVGFQELLSIVHKFDFNVAIAFDSDFPPKEQVQQAAASLGFELRSSGIPLTRIRQLILPNDKKEKVALDDFLEEKGTEALVSLLHEMLKKRSAFPKYPNMKEFVNSRMDSRMSREETKSLAAAVLADMDTRGTRLKDANTGEPYYFDNEIHTLMKVSLLRHSQEPLHETKFGRFLYQAYDISQADGKLLPWLAASFTGEAPIYDVRPYSTIAILPDDTVAYQISDAQYVRITADPKKPFLLKNNGDDGILFKGDQVDPLDVDKFKVELTKAHASNLSPWWREVLGEFKFVRAEDVNLATLLFYISPWLLRWRGTQLPVELMIGEPGSGKSTMYMLRMAILTGRPTLRNQPADVRDWYSSITTSDGLHVTDNVHFVTKEIKQRLSDEICRIVTEPDPFIELRKLYTTSDNYRIPVRSIFALTAIQQPFSNADIIQRAAIFELKAVGGEHDSSWLQRHLSARNGREGWVAHHLEFIHRFLVKSTTWDKKYRSTHRLVNYEQALSMAADVLGMGSAEYVVKTMMRSADEQVSEYDWTMDGLKEFALWVSPQLQKDPKKAFACRHVSDWAMAHEDYKDNQNFASARKVARYFKAHFTMITKVTGIYEVGKASNQMTYRVKAPKSI